MSRRWSLLPQSHPQRPNRILVEGEIERWVEIHEATGRLITVLEWLSPSNKVELTERDRYHRKRESFISSGVNLVEIDLIRRGTPVFAERIRKELQNADASRHDSHRLYASVEVDPGFA